MSINIIKLLANTITLDMLESQKITENKFNAQFERSDMSI